MKKNQKILVLNTGGTFNKIYNPINGNLEILSNNHNIDEILNKAKILNCEVDGIIYKDSLNMTKYDRKKIVDYILQSHYKKIIIIHGTDTMDKTAKYLAKYIKNKQIILTGSMIPFSIDSVEASSNLMQSYGYLLHNYKKKKNNIFISMHGLIKKYKKIKKNKSLGIFR